MLAEYHSNIIQHYSPNIKTLAARVLQNLNNFINIFKNILSVLSTWIKYSYNIFTILQYYNIFYIFRCYVEYILLQTPTKFGLDLQTSLYFIVSTDGTCRETNENSKMLILSSRKFKTYLHQRKSIFFLIITILFYTVKNVMKFTICLLFNVVWILKIGFNKKKSIYFTLEIK